MKSEWFLIKVLSHFLKFFHQNEIFNIKHLFKHSFIHFVSFYLFFDIFFYTKYEILFSAGKCHFALVLFLVLVVVEVVNCLLGSLLLLFFQSRCGNGCCHCRWWWWWWWWSCCCWCYVHVYPLFLWNNVVASNTLQILSKKYI